MEERNEMNQNPETQKTPKAERRESHFPKTGIMIVGGVIFVGTVAYLAHKAGVDKGLKMAVNTNPVAEDAIVIARDALAQNPEVAQNLFYEAQGKKDLLADILKGLCNRAGIYLERLGDVVPEGITQVENPAHVVNF